MKCIIPLLPPADRKRSFKQHRCGIIVRGLVCDGRYKRNRCDNLIIRHLRSRPARYLLPAAQRDRILDDALRLDGVRDFIIDHGSFAHADDEAIQISWASNGTIQNSIRAETIGEHAEHGDMLINYSHTEHPQDNLSIHHNMWHRIEGHMPELSCELSGYGDEDVEIPSHCSRQPLHLELSNNLLWDQGRVIWYNDNSREDTGQPEAGIFRLNLNWVNNFGVARADYSEAMFLNTLIEQPGNSLFLAGNRMNLYPEYQDDQLIYCCNDFAEHHPNTERGSAARRAVRHLFPLIQYTPTTHLVDYMIQHAGAFPRDPMDRRFIASLQRNQIEPMPRDRSGADDVFRLGFDPAAPPSPPRDTDSDGMPDDWERNHGLNPAVPDHNGLHLSRQITGVEEYTNLECYLNMLADSLVTGN
jgi:pectate lyase